MPNFLDLKVKLNLTGPHNVKPVVAALQSQLNKVQGKIALKIDPRISSNVGNLSKRLDTFNSKLRDTVVSANSAHVALKRLSDTFRSLGNSSKVAIGINKTEKAVRQTAKSTQEAAN